MSALATLERRGDVAILWMADAQRRNALSTKMVEEMCDALAASREDGVRAVVIASDQKLFCAGADIRDMLDNGWLEQAPGARTVITPPDLFAAIERDPRPIVAAVDGLALGGGVELCLACDLVIAGPRAAFMLPELELGVLPNTALARLPELIGRRAAADLILTRRKVDAEEALRLGLITTLVSEGALDQAVATAAAICAGAPPGAIGAAKANLARGCGSDAVTGMLADMDGKEWREGVSAFLEKRAPRYERFWAARLRKI